MVIRGIAHTARARRGTGLRREFWTAQHFDGTEGLSRVGTRFGFRTISIEAHSKVDFLCEDLLKVDLPAQHFDVILNCSSVGHVGLRVAAEETDGDLQAMRRFFELMKHSGRMLLIPCGRDAAIRAVGTGCTKNNGRQSC